MLEQCKHGREVWCPKCYPEQVAKQEMIAAVLNSVASTLSLPDDSAARKNLPIAQIMQRYFPKAFAYVALVAKRGNDQHNPGEPMHWAREKSSDHTDCIARHLIDAGQKDGKGIRHSGGLAWRALANLQLELEAAEARGERWWEDGASA